MPRPRVTSPMALFSGATQSSLLESIVAALRMKYTTDLTWEAIMADLIQEYKRFRGGDPVENKDRDKGGRSKTVSMTAKTSETHIRQEHRNVTQIAISVERHTRL